MSEALTKITATNRRQYFPKVKARCEGHISQYKFILLRLALLAVCNAQRESYDKAKISSQDLWLTVWSQLDALTLVAFNKAQDAPSIREVV